MASGRTTPQVAAAHQGRGRPRLLPRRLRSMARVDIGFCSVTILWPLLSLYIRSMSFWLSRIVDRSSYGSLQNRGTQYGPNIVSSLIEKSKTGPPIYAKYCMGPMVQCLRLLNGVEAVMVLTLIILK